MSDILLDPAKTRLIIIGVGETGQTDAASRAFSASAREVSDFFQQRIGLRKDDGHSGFVPGSENMLGGVISFLVREKPDNVFVFVFAHGKMHEMGKGKSPRRGLSFYSEPNPSDGASSALDFKELLVSVTQRMESKRAVFIVDSCFSGLCHSIVEDVNPEKTDVLVITSNSRGHEGVVKACEEGGEGGASVFTREFLKVVKDGLSEDGAKDRPLLSLEDICKHLRKKIPETGLCDGMKEEDKERHIPSCSSWGDEDAVKTCGIFLNYRCVGSLQAQLLDVRIALYSDYNNVKTLQQNYDQTQAALKEKNEKYEDLVGNYNVIIKDLGDVKAEGKARYQMIQQIGNTLQRGINEEHAAIETFMKQVESFKKEVDTKLAKSDAKDESRSQALREYFACLDGGLKSVPEAMDEMLKAIPGDVAEKLKTDLRTVSTECARWRRLAWTFGICGFAAAAAFAYVLVSGPS